ncbi:MAG TPA: RHS repeat-associated core domain-containing protein [Thermoanaerobaculia bacterium]
MPSRVRVAPRPAVIRDTRLKGSRTASSVPIWGYHARPADEAFAAFLLDTDEPSSREYQRFVHILAILLYEHEPYGSIHTHRTGIAKHQPLRFPGQERPVGGELSYNVFRWYRDGWGRYTQADPIGLAAGGNLYAYVDANPVRWSDPFGLIKPVKPKDQAWRKCNPQEEQQCIARCKYGMESCMVSRTFRVVRAKNGMTVRGWMDGPMSCSCKEPDCWDKLKDWVKDLLPDPAPPVRPLPPFMPPVPPPVPLPVPEPVIPGFVPIFNPCMMNPSLCYGPGGSA